ncbi:hypothetical protein [Microlunatus soli]|uniref:Uncharacterized protein n=1 Tax=Microlunatus soli TaxID=630515 RepID=A0A1H1QZZ5_9ACTN|nr:hypothetical protein [Microlunatus soli]SDS28339.1 hypothetical protein SAMN04489812_1433 [Microlunatus soli]
MNSSAMLGTMSLTDVLADVAAERARQDARWGEQNHPDGTGADYTLSEVPELDVRFARTRCDRAFERGAGSWEHILYEEFCEAMAEDDPARLRAELLQLAAVAVHWMEAIDARQAPAAQP